MRACLGGRGGTGGTGWVGREVDTAGAGPGLSGTSPSAGLAGGGGSERPGTLSASSSQGPQAPGRWLLTLTSPLFKFSPGHPLLSLY